MANLDSDNLHSTLKSRKEAFRDASISLCEVLSKEMIITVPFRDPEVPYFSKMEIEHQELLINSFKVQIELMESMPKQGLSFINSNRILVISFLHKMGLGYASDLLDYLDDSDFVAAYNNLLQMIFLTPNHLLWMTYSLEDLHCRPWPELIKRDPEINQKLIQRGKDFANGKLTTTILSEDIPPHTASEISGAERASAVIYPKLYSPLFKNGKPAGFLVANQDRFTYQLDQLKARTRV